MPLMTWTIIASFLKNVFASERVWRRYCEGTARTTTLASFMHSSNDELARTVGKSVTWERYVLFWCVALISSASSLRLAHKKTKWPFPPRRDAKAVPKLPAPMIAIAAMVSQTDILGGKGGQSPS